MEHESLSKKILNIANAAKQVSAHEFASKKHIEMPLQINTNLCFSSSVDFGHCVSFALWCDTPMGRWPSQTSVLILSSIRMSDKNEKHK